MKILTLALLLTLAGCDDGESAAAAGTNDVDVGAPDAAPMDGGAPDIRDEPADEEAPALRDVRVRFGDTMLDLNTGDAEWTLPRAQEAVFTVLARDDIADAEVLTVEVVDAEMAPVPGQSAELRNGLWAVTTPVEPGRSYRVTVTDGAGNEGVSEHALVLRPFAEVVPGTWVHRFYDTEQTVVGRWATTFAEDGTWERTRDDVTETGTWAIEAERLVMEWRTSTDPDAGDDDPDTVELRRETAFWLDGRAFDPDVLRRSDGGEGPEGVWTREVREGDETYTVTLTLGDDGRFTEEVTGARDFTRSGTWSWELSENYVESSGDFLSRTVEVVDGAPLDAPEVRFELAQLHGEWLLLTPMLRTEAQ